MTDLEKILVLGATGNIGFSVVQTLTEHGVAVRAGVSNPEKSKALWEDNSLVDVMHFDFLDSSTFPDTLEGVTKVFFCPSPAAINAKRRHVSIFTLFKSAIYRSCAIRLFNWRREKSSHASS